VSSIAERYRQIRAEVPSTVTIVLAAKMQQAEHVREAIYAGADNIGHNYVQQAVTMHAALGADAHRARWHLIGTLQKNKINKALPVCDTVQTIDSAEIAGAIDARMIRAGKQSMPVLVEVNSGNEPSKGGVPPTLDALVPLVRSLAALERVVPHGLMTMAPYDDDPEKSRPYFRATRELLEGLRRELPELPLDTLSMGMSHSYRVAIEEGATMVRIGSAVFGARE